MKRILSNMLIGIAFVLLIITLISFIICACWSHDVFNYPLLISITGWMLSFIAFLLACRLSEVKEDD